MRKSFTIIMLGVACLTASMAQADDLFSNVSIGSPFGSSESQGALPAQPAPQRLAGPASLSDMLAKAGLQPKELDTRIVSVNVSSGGKTLPVLMTFADDNEQLRVVMVLSILQENETPTTDQLIALMDANRENSSVFFAFSKKQRRIELHRIVKNQSLTPNRLKEELIGLLRVAQQSRDVWATMPAEEQTPPQEGTASTPAESTPESNPAPAPTENASAQPQPRRNTLQLGLIGQWTAARSKTEAFALRLDNEGTFALVTVINGKTSQSKGTYTIDSSKLTLKDEKGTQLTGTVTLKSGKEFSFQPTGASNPLTFKKAG